MQSSILLLGLTSLIPAVLADRGTATNVITATFNATSAKSTPVAKRVEPAFPDVAGRRRSFVLNKRAGQVTYADNCNDAPPKRSGYSDKNGFPTKKSVLQQAYNDAVTLAKASENAASDNKGFTHYFGGEKADVQLTHFQNMMKGIASTTNNYAIQFSCGNAKPCKKGSIMVTDATPGSATDVKTIEVCNDFWTSSSTNYLLYDSGKTSPSPPYRNNDDKGWCAKKTEDKEANVSKEKDDWFTTAGHSVLHELTHLDSLAKVAGLDGDSEQNNAHGTVDDQKKGDPSGAREFLTQYKDGKTGGTSPDYNAESYAAAATEIYFMHLCSFSEVSPVVKS